MPAKLIPATKGRTVTRLEFYLLTVCLAVALGVMFLLLGLDGVLALWLFMGVVVLLIFLEEHRRFYNPVIWGICMIVGGWLTVLFFLPETRYVKRRPKITA